MTQTIELITVLKELHAITGFRISVYNTEIAEICAYPKEITGFCSYIQSTDTGKNHCKEYDKNAFNIVKETGEAYIYKCHFGLYEAVAPLYHYGILSGYLMMGQTLDTTEDNAAYTYQVAKDYVTDYNQLRSAISTIPIISKDKIQSCITILKICASYITMNNSFKSSSKELPNQIKQYINKNYASNITIDTLSNVLLCSKSTLSTAFKNAFQKTIIEYLTEVRLQHAILLLDNPSLSIKTIASSCGFSEQNYFTKVFQKYHHMSPVEYRKRSKNDIDYIMD